MPTTPDPAAPAADAGESTDTETSTEKKSSVVAIVGAVVGLLVLVAVVFWLCNNGKCSASTKDALPRQVPRTVQNAAFVDPNQQIPYGEDDTSVMPAGGGGMANAAFVDPNQQMPHGEHEAPPVMPVGGGGIIVQPVEEMYLEADPKQPDIYDNSKTYETADPNRASIYDQGRLAGAASHALRDQRRTSQLVDAAAAAAAANAAAAASEDAEYEEFDEGGAAPGKRRNTMRAADRCHRPAPTGGTCTNPKVGGSNFCTSHLCEYPGCNQGRSSRVTACPTHLVAAAAGEKAQPPRLRASSAGGGQGIRRGGEARKGSVYDGVGGNAGGGGGGDSDDADLDC